MNIIPNREDGTKELFLKKDRPQITPENAVEFLESLEWYVYGGSFFDSTGTIGKGALQLD
ncbi:hypothetical protein HX13_09300 [Chryseobacterium sp. P1-3]|uniref:hypothetical protein n=1 Tax=Chryseobacterium sp. (strain P1-3) TaxID=1517683 RepID=UPI0004E63757|nr:hypothetical protein [Chryseobacterium sp. P1-3]KFF74368.1 hypothetical protein HX13_09300 [Chryseobacterium sp. P1-3]